VIRVIVAEDQSMVLGALAALLEIDKDIDVVAQARDGREALDLVIAEQPDVLVTDIEMPHMSGLEVVLTTFARAGYLRRALDAGATGYLLKDSPSDELANAIRRVHAGGRAVDPVLAQEAWTEKDPLSDRERQVLRLASEGLPGTAIAVATNLSEGTVRNYLSDAIAKLGAANRVEAARIARTKGWL
jgi:two-component system response regulator DesR